MSILYGVFRQLTGIYKMIKLIKRYYLEQLYRQAKEVLKKRRERKAKKSPGRSL